MKSIYQDAYQSLLTLLVEARNTSGLTQQQVADKLGRPQSFISKIENGDRRLDVIEFLEICRLLDTDPHALLKRIDGTRKRR
ncbi:helix-turn-helix domain-containing protein [Thermomonas carbonis]|uniref:Helix-turn-helix transcriptional regulator n=1 Tax=Thermomonas carbonis TaxID=1463158 RepID=A0A7G9SLP3_9GAMM|nr:helix-turn-helix transcriptional regulator [Thermomonas carbonis]QNN68768.1 helix-turn-helix transcriptional regulator [Thermomonas carbonis]